MKRTIKGAREMEQIVMCDNKGNFIGPIGRLEAHEGDNRINIAHCVSWGMVYDVAIKKYLIQRKSQHHIDHSTAGRWDESFAGHNIYIKRKGSFIPMDFEETLKKEAKEEIGLSFTLVKDENDFVLEANNCGAESIGVIFDRFYCKTQKNNEFVALGFILVQNLSPVFNEEVSEHKWLTPKELEEFLNSGQDYCSSLKVAFEKAEVFRGKKGIK